MRQIFDHGSLRYRARRAAISVLVAAAIGVVPAPLACAQTAPAPAPAHKFDVASIKPCENQGTGRRSGGTANWSPGRLTLNCQTVMSLIDRAYLGYAEGRVRIWPPQLTIGRGPAWINSASYRIEAKSEGSEGRGLLNGPMLEGLLEDRFDLKVHRETREVPVYALTVARGGAKLQPFQEGSCVAIDFEKQPAPPDPAKRDPVFCTMSESTAKGYRLYGTTLADFATEFSARLDRPVIDKTGIAGLFNIELDLSSADLYPAARSGDSVAPPNPPDPGAVVDAVRRALRKVGLNLESTRGPGEYLVIDRIEKPTEN